MKKEIQDLQSSLDAILINSACQSAQLATLEQVFLTSVKESLVEEEFRKVITNYYTVLQRNTEMSLLKLQDVVYDKGALLQTQFEVVSAIQRNLN